MEAVSVNLFLAQGKHNGLRIAEITNWSGKAIAAPRSEISKDEFNKQGVYILTGIDPETNKKTIYIGESENISNHLDNVLLNEDSWNNITAFVSKYENFTHSELKYLKENLVQLVNNDNSTVMNVVNNNVEISESSASIMDGYLEKCLLILPVLGIVDFI